jgi:acyl-coenzyme A synthetase/AMP-(fatty) acid ligase
MTLNLYKFPINTHSTFLVADKRVSGQQWAKECLTLAEEISRINNESWLLYENDYYQFSLYFFALLIANKHIVLAQSNQLSRLQQAASLADICIGTFELNNDSESPLLPQFSPALSKVNSATVDLSIHANTRITLFTSGSSGEAKAITKYWYQLANEVSNIQTLFPHQDSYLLSTVTHKHIYGLLFKLLWPIYTDKKIITDTIEFPEQLEHFSHLFEDIVLISSPSYLARTSEELSANAKHTIKEIFSSGAALPAKVAQDYTQIHQQHITEIYGSTETGGIAWRQQTIEPKWLLFPGHQATQSEDGTLLLKSNFLPKGETYKTDDKIALNGRHFSLLGRVDRIIKLHEKRLSLDEMEATLNKIESVNDCHCFVLSNSQSKVTLVSVIELAKHEALPTNIDQKKSLVHVYKKVLSTLFEASLLPRKWRIVNKLPYNSQGKLVKAELEKLFE